MKNNKRIRIASPYISENSDYARLNTELFIDDQKVYTLWYEVDKVYKDYLCTERSDGIVVNLLLYAMEHGYDIESEQSLSLQLYYRLSTYLIPAISKNIKKYSNNIKIIAPTSSTKLQSHGAVGGAVSGGVDSFYTLLKHLDWVEEGLNISHLAFFNAGASGASGGTFAKNRFEKRIDWIKDVSIFYGTELVLVDTNINEFLVQPHEPTHTFRTLAIPLILQKLFSIYYFSSAYEYKDFQSGQTHQKEIDRFPIQ